MNRILSFTSAVLLLSVLLCSCSDCKTSKTNTATGIYFDTLVKLSVYGDDVPASAFDICEKYEKLLSVSRPESDVSRINNGEGKVTVNEKTAGLLADALSFCAASDGEFDITLYPVKKLWGFGTKNAAVPSDTALKNALKKVDYTKILIDKNTVTVPKDTQIDLGAIAKGFIADEIAKLYKEKKLSGIIDLGGNLLTVGEKPDNTDYRIGIKSPFNTEKNAAVLEFSGGSVVTSGSYERYFESGGKRYHHILSTKTGYPTENELASVTVIDNSSEKADALSTTLFLMGRDKGLSYVNSLDGTEAVFITTDGDILLSGGLTKKGDTISFK